MYTPEQRSRPAESPHGAPPASTRTEAERAVMKLAHSLASAGYGVLVWNWPGSPRGSADSPKTRT